MVHLALDRHGRAVAIKVLRQHIAHDPDARARLTREVRTLSRITSPRVAPIIDADVDGDTHAPPLDARWRRTAVEPAPDAWLDSASGPRHRFERWERD